MSSSYPILDDRPIDKWKVTELREELKRRKLTTKGLKEELVKRLREALRVERENSEKEDEEAGKGDEEIKTSEEGNKDAVETPVASEEGNKNAKKTAVAVEETPVAAKAMHVVAEVMSVSSEEKPVAAEEPSAAAKEKPLSVKETPMSEEQNPVDIDMNSSKASKTMPLAGETTSIDDEKSHATGYGAEGKLLSDAGESKEEAEDAKGQFDINETAADLVEGEGLKSERNDAKTGSVDKEPVHKATMETGGIATENPLTEVAKSVSDLEAATVQDGKGLNSQLDNEGSKAQLDVKDLSAQPRDVPLAKPTSNKQVSEVSPSLGFEVKSDSISTDSVSINENVELKDAIIADNVKLENSVKSEMVEPSSSRDTNPVGGGSHLMDVEEPLDKKKPFGRGDYNKSFNADMTEKNDNVDVAYSEKLNLDRSSGDESMEEDVLESKEIDSKDNSGDLRNMSEKTKATAALEERAVDVVGVNVSVSKGDNHVDKTRQEVIGDKRKLDQVVGNSEPVKRQRRWNSESVKVSKVVESDGAPKAATKDEIKSSAFKRSFSKSNSGADEDGEKERVVPLSEKDATNSLRSDHFLRPFTLKAVQELLGKTGKVTNFWMDHIKTHCYVSYSTVEEAMETRNSVYHLQWPPNGGRLLVAEFVDPQEVKARVEGAPTPTLPGSGPTANASQPKPQAQAPARQQIAPHPLLQPPTTALSNAPPARERLPPPPPVVEKQEPPIVTLDDLFRKTKATPRIYYLPLSKEEVAAKLAAQGTKAD